MQSRAGIKLAMPAPTVIFRARYRAASLVISIAVVVLCSASSSAQLIRQRATAARTIRLSDTAQLHLVAHEGTQVLHEQGQASGTLRGSLTVVIDLGYTEATVTFSARSSSGTLKGHGVEEYYVSGKNGHFRGRMTVTGGSGAYAHASGSSLGTTGLIRRGRYEVQMTVNGELKA